MVCWFFHAEKPGAFPQEKTDTSYPRASLGSCLGNCCSHGFNRADLGLPWCRFPTLSPKPHTGPHGGEFGFGPLAGACQEDCPPFRQSRVKNRAEEKTPLPCFSKIEPVKFVIPCKRFSKLPGENPFSLFSGADFALPQADPRTYAPRYFRTQTADPAFPWPGPHITSFFGGTARPALPAPFCTPRPRGWAGSCTGAHRFVLCRLFPGRWSFLCR